MKKKAAIIGAGVTGLVAALKLSKDYDVEVFEKEKFIGGMSGSFKYKNFTLDYGPHKIYSQIPGVVEDINDICPLLKIKKSNSIRLRGSFFDFPVKMGQIAVKLPFTALSAGIDMFLKYIIKQKDDSYSGYLENRFGYTLYNLVFKGYAWKVWGNPILLDAELARRRVAVSGIFQLIKSVIIKDKTISADYFYYPPKGSFQLYELLAEKIKKNGGKISLNKKIEKVILKNNKVEGIKIGKKIDKVDYLISTIDLDRLVELMELPAEVKENARKLEYVDLNIIYFILNKERALKDNWIFFPERKFLFNRVSEQKSFSQFTCPKDKTALMVETTKEANKESINLIKEQLIKIGLVKENEIIDIFTKKLNRAYPIYKKGFKKNLDFVLNYFDEISNLLTIGRRGLFNYNNIDQCWDMAVKAAEHIKGNWGKEDWKKMRKFFDKYKIVD